MTERQLKKLQSMVPVPSGDWSDPSIWIDVTDEGGRVLYTKPPVGVEHVSTYFVGVPFLTIEE